MGAIKNNITFISMNNELLMLAINKFKSKNKFTPNEYLLPIEDFILKMYLNCDPSSYGNQFVKKLLKDNFQKGINLGKLTNTSDTADICQTSHLHWYEDYFCLDDDAHTPIPLHFNDIEKSLYEVKISYLTKANNYTIRNIRPYQTFDYFLLCFVDCSNNFLPNFFVVTKEYVLNELTLNPMNGTKEANKDNKNIVYGTTLSKNGGSFYLMKNCANLLNGTSYTHLNEFFISEHEILKQKNQPFINKIAS